MAFTDESAQWSLNAKGEYTISLTKGSLLTGTGNTTMGFIDAARYSKISFTATYSDDDKIVVQGKHRQNYTGRTNAIRGTANVPATNVTLTTAGGIREESLNCTSTTWILMLPPLPKSEILIYQHANYSGAVKSLAVGNYDINQLGIPNDSLSSLKVPSGIKVTLYEHAGFNGETLVITKDTSFVDSFNDKTSSIKVESITCDSGQSFAKNEYPIFECHCKAADGTSLARAVYDWHNSSYNSSESYNVGICIDEFDTECTKSTNFIVKNSGFHYYKNNSDPNNPTYFRCNSSSSINAFGDLFEPHYPTQVSRGDDSETLEALTGDVNDNATCDSAIASMDEFFSVDIPCVIVEESLLLEKRQLTLFNEEPLNWIIDSQEESVCEPSDHCAILTEDGFLVIHDVILFDNTIYDAILKENDSGQWEYQTHYPTP